MELQEWVFRVLFGLLIANIFIGGTYAFIRGYFENYMLKKFWVRKIAQLNRSGKFHASISWTFKGESMTSIDHTIFTIRKRVAVSVYMEPTGYRIRLNVWHKNGVGMMLLGITLIASSLLLFFFLIF